MSEQRIDSSRWTGDLSSLQEPVDPKKARAKLRRALPFIVVLAFTMLYTVGWHMLWKASGSPPVYSLTTWLDLLVPLAAGVAGYFVGRGLGKRPFMCAAVTGCVAVGVYILGTFLLDLHRPRAQGEQRAFVESAFPQNYFSRYSTRLQHELRLRVSRRRPVEASVPGSLYRQVIAGDTCLLIRWSGGRRYRFFEVVRHLPTGDGNGSWVNAPEDRARCLRGG